MATIFKILKGQGPAAPLGKLDYLIQDCHDRRLCTDRGARRVPRYRRQDASSSARRESYIKRTLDRIHCKSRKTWSFITPTRPGMRRTTSGLTALRNTQVAAQN